MKYVPEDTDFRSFIEELKKSSQIEFSEDLIDIISESGDMAGSPYAHWRWKKKFIADVVIWPEKEEEVVEIVKLANRFSVPITPRGAGTCYFGSNNPTFGGIILDLKRMTNYNVNKDENKVITQTGISFQTLNNNLIEDSFELGGYPSSALASTIGGWVGTGGSHGIGTYHYGSFVDQILDMKVVNPMGDIQIVDSKKDIDKFFGTCGIFGIITEISLKIYPCRKKKSLFIGYNKLNDLISMIQKIKQMDNLYLISFTDKNYEMRNLNISNYNYYFFIVLIEGNETFSHSKEQIEKISKKYSGNLLSNEISEQKWKAYLKQETKIKRDTPVLTLQSIKTNLENCKDLIKNFEALAEKRILNHCIYGSINHDLSVRLLLITPTDNKKIYHFLASKALSHRIVKNIYKTEKGEVYSYGLQNSIYLDKFESDKVEKWRKLKSDVDPNFIFNPLKLVETKTSYRRINTIFEMNLFWRKIAAKIKTAKRVNFPKDKSLSKKPEQTTLGKNLKSD
ncbi:MAG: FAD-binding protein [Candidatus Lokiarchaeota archaeon]|nr:FAD-binding protein [Candidatus Lokiarchaeota archaeon]MBD3338885.1 FAD-binding protein [Candidatus Lokiarchaeota archaeon]